MHTLRTQDAGGTSLAHAWTWVSDMQHPGRGENKFLSFACPVFAGLMGKR